MSTKKERSTSEIIKDFLDLLETSKAEYLRTEKIIEKYDEETLKWVHKIESAEKAEERSKIATAWHKERLERRKEKNTYCLYREIYKFAIDEMNKPTIKRIRNLLQRQEQAEEYIVSQDKEYKSKRRLERLEDEEQSDNS